MDFRRKNAWHPAAFYLKLACMRADLVLVRPMARILSLLACWIAVAALAEPNGSAAKDNTAEVIHMERPNYRFELRKWHIEGTGLFLLHVRPDGSVQSVDTVQSTGNSMADGEAKTAFRRWRFRPGRSMNVKMAMTFSERHGVYVCMALTTRFRSVHR
jgi:TonB family protein